MRSLRVELATAKNRFLFIAPAADGELFRTRARVEVGQKRIVPRRNGPEDDQTFWVRGRAQEYGLPSRREHSLQRDAEIQRQIGLHVVMRETAARRRECLRSHLHEIGD